MAPPCDVRLSHWFQGGRSADLNAADGCPSVLSQQGLKRAFLWDMRRLVRRPAPLGAVLASSGRRRLGCVGGWESGSGHSGWRCSGCSETFGHGVWGSLAGVGARAGGSSPMPVLGVPLSGVVC